jgi:hypothetical protein
MSRDTARGKLRPTVCRPRDENFLNFLLNARNLLL